MKRARVASSSEADTVKDGTSLNITNRSVEERQKLRNIRVEPSSKENVDGEQKGDRGVQEKEDNKDTEVEKSDEGEKDNENVDESEGENNLGINEQREENKLEEGKGELGGFENMAGVGEGTDNSDEEAMMEKVAVGLLPGRVISEARDDKAGLERKLAEISVFTGEHGLSFSESLYVEMPLQGTLEDELATDDLKRERRFAELATEAVHMGLDRLRRDNVRFRRPGDYFAEMVKGDAHMGKVKGRLMQEKEKIEGAEKRRNNREIAKNKRKVRSTQMEREQDKRRKAKEEIEAFSQLRKKRLREREEKGNEGKEDGEEFPIDLLEVERLDDENRFRPDKEFGEGKRKGWSKAKDTVFVGKKGREDERNGKSGKRQKEKNGPVGGVQKQKKEQRGKKKRLGRSRRKAGAK